jgi:putative Mg2+ transporter-C (MgtC) family protein
VSNGDQLEMLGRLVVALVLGAAIGLEREYRGHEAGLRTSALVCVGAAFFGEVSALFDDSRVAAGVVQGIGFQGAGLIFRAGDGVQNVTTAVTVWVLAATGLAVAARLPIVAVGATLTMLVLLESAPLSARVYQLGRRRRGAPEDEG